MLTSFADAALNLLAPILVAALVGFIAQVMKKHGIEMTQAQHDYAVQVFTEASHFAEEKFAGQTGAGASKLAAAIEHVQIHLPMTDEEASRGIHAALPDSGHGATAVDPVSGRAT